VLAVNILRNLVFEFTIYHVLGALVLLSLITVIGSLSQKKPLKFIGYWTCLSIVIYVAEYLLFFRDTSEMAQAARSETDYRGRIIAGTKFGVTIGNSIEEVTTTLRRQNVRYDEVFSKEQSRPNECHEYEYTNIDRIRIYSDDSWRRGILCVVVKNDKLVAMSWFFQPGSP